MPTTKEAISRLFDHMEGPHADQFEALVAAALDETQGDLDAAIDLAREAMGPDAKFGQWITIGGHEDAEEGVKHKGGFKVYIDEEGTILKGGPKGLQGKKVGETKAFFDGERAKKGREDEGNPKEAASDAVAKGEKNPSLPEVGVSGAASHAHYLTYSGRLSDKLAELVRKNHPGKAIPEGILDPKRIQSRFDLGIRPEDAAEEIYHDLVKPRIDRMKTSSMREIVEFSKQAAERNKAEQEQKPAEVADAAKQEDRPFAPPPDHAADVKKEFGGMPMSKIAAHMREQGIEIPKMDKKAMLEAIAKSRGPGDDAESAKPADEGGGEKPPDGEAKETGDMGEPAGLHRADAASKIVDALESDDMSASIWSQGDKVRVYLKTVKQKSRGRREVRDNGYIELNADGTIDYNTDRQSGEIRSLVEKLGLQIQAQEAKPAQARRRPERVEGDAAEEWAAKGGFDRPDREGDEKG